MNSEQAKELNAAIQKIGDRLVELKYADGFIWDRARNVGRFKWSDKGLVLVNSIREIYHVPNGQRPSFTQPELIALAAMLLSCESDE